MGKVAGKDRREFRREGRDSRQRNSGIYPGFYNNPAKGESRKSPGAGWVWGHSLIPSSPKSLPLPPWERLEFFPHHARGVFLLPSPKNREQRDFPTPKFSRFLPPALEAGRSREQLNPRTEFWGRTRKSEGNLGWDQQGWSTRPGRIQDLGDIWDTLWFPKHTLVPRPRSTTFLGSFSLKMRLKPIKVNPRVPKMGIKCQWKWIFLPV